jgi:hypothetical protein
VNLNPLAGVRSIEFPHTSKLTAPAITVSALPDPAMCVVQLLVVVTYSTPAQARAGDITANAIAAAATIALFRGTVPRPRSMIPIMLLPPVAATNERGEGIFSRGVRARHPKPSNVDGRPRCRRAACRQLAIKELQFLLENATRRR